MRVEYLPGIDPNWNKIRDFACGIMLPNTFSKTRAQKYKWGMITHGMGELNAGLQSHLEKLVEKGFDWNNDGVADSFFISEDMKRAVDLHDIIIVVPTYSNHFEPAIVNRIYDHMVANYNVQATFMFQGFSRGGEAVFRYTSSSDANAKRVHLAVPVAAPYGLSSAFTAAKNGTVFHAFSNDKDDRVSSSNTVKQVNDINGQNPAIKALYTLFRRDGHGGDKEAMSLTAPKASGGQGFTDAAETIWQLNDAILATGPRQMKSGTVVQPPAPPVDPEPLPVSPVANFNLVDAQVITTTTFEMDASTSIGSGKNWDSYKWDVTPVNGVGAQYGVQPDGAYGGPKKKLLSIVDGKYKITLTVKSPTGETASKTVTVDAKIGGTTTRSFVGFDSATDTIAYSDGSTEKGSAVFAAGKWTVKNAAGEIIGQ